MTDALTASGGEVLDAYVAAAQQHRSELAPSLVRTRSRGGRAILARLVAAGRTATELETFAREYLTRARQMPRLNQWSRHVDLGWAADYAALLAVQPASPTDRDAARGLYLALLDATRGAALERRDAELLLQLSLKAADFVTAERVLASMPLRLGVRQLTTTDLANPWLRPGRDEASWLDVMNTNLYGGDLSPVALLPDGETPFDRLTTGPGTPVSHEARITVIMSCFNPDQHLLTAVRSVVEQTWRNFELLVVDDASPHPTPGILAEVARLDPRVRVIRKAVNGGTYRARNTALRQSTGDFFTCLDSDDWAHPQRLELGIRPLLRYPGLIATRGAGVRATEDLELSRIGYGGRLVASSSLMVRHFPAFNRVGFFDPVRKAADNEYALRLEAAFGTEVLELPRHALTVLLADDSSLSASDFSAGWRHPSRAEYAESQQHFHQQVRDGQRRAFVDVEGPRAFPAPRRWQRYPQDGEPGPVLDLCIVADWRDGVVTDDTLRVVQRAVDRGLSTAVVHVESLHDLRRREAPVAPVLRAHIAASAVERIYLDDDRQVRHVLIADPRPFQFSASIDVRLRTDDVRIAPDGAAEAAGQYDRAAVSENLTGMLDVAPRWAPLELPQAGDHGGAVHVAFGAAVPLDFRGAQPCLAEGATVRYWPLREAADGARGASLVLVGAETLRHDVTDVAELTDSWSAGPSTWARQTVGWLADRPYVWCVAVRASEAVHLVTGTGVAAAAVEQPGRPQPDLVLRPADVAPQLTTLRAGQLTRSPVEL